MYTIRMKNIDESENKENQIDLKRSETSMNLNYFQRISNKLTQVNTMLYTANQRQYMIKVSQHIYSWNIPSKYYYFNMDPVKAFLQNNRIKDHNNRFFWEGRYKIHNF